MHATHQNTILLHHIYTCILCGISNLIFMKKLTKPPSIDLTPMVDLGFLLLTTFMLISFYSKPRLLELNMPDYECYKDYDCILTISDMSFRTLFLEKDSVYCQRGQFLFPKNTIQPMAYADLRSYILKQQTEMDKDKKQGLYRPNEGIVYLIKPMPNSRYENLVDVLDEMTICDVAMYAIVEVTPQEKVQLAQR